jgi:two-component system, LytTR family, sensor kinase
MSSSLRSVRLLLIHGSAWLAFFLYEWIFKQGVLNNPETSYFHFQIVVIRVLTLMPVVYFTLYFLMPVLLFRGHRFGFVSGLMLAIVIDAFVMKSMTWVLILKGREGFADTYWKSLGNITGWLIFSGNIAFNISFAAMIYLINKWAIDEKTRQQLQTAKKEAELSLLKSQVQPHFIFNTLNNIYALSKRQAAETSEMIHRLSNLLAYMIYDSNKEWISLRQEVAYIEDYIAIEKIRYGDRLDVSLQIYTDTSRLTVPPLILLPFIENSFKHGLSMQAETCWIRIEITEVPGWIIFKVENSVSEEVNTSVRSGGTGISNVKKRLDILLNKNYSLSQTESGDRYLVALKLKIDL